MHEKINCGEIATSLARFKTWAGESLPVKSEDALDVARVIDVIYFFL